MSDICVHCGKLATRYNKGKQPTCLRCMIKPEKVYICSKCKNFMVIRKGKYGSFWSCCGYPICDNSVSLKKAFTKTKKK